jgi:hypothetical protein
MKIILKRAVQREQKIHKAETVLEVPKDEAERLIKLGAAARYNAASAGRSDPSGGGNNNGTSTPENPGGNTSPENPEGGDNNDGAGDDDPEAKPDEPKAGGDPLQTLAGVAVEDMTTKNS